MPLSIRLAAPLTATRKLPAEGGKALSLGFQSLTMALHGTHRCSALHLSCRRARARAAVPIPPGGACVPGPARVALPLLHRPALRRAARGAELRPDPQLHGAWRFQAGLDQPGQHCSQRMHLQMRRCCAKPTWRGRRLLVPLAVLVPAVALSQNALLPQVWNKSDNKAVLRLGAPACSQQTHHWFFP